MIKAPYFPLRKGMAIWLKCLLYDWVCYVIGTIFPCPVQPLPVYGLIFVIKRFDLISCTALLPPKCTCIFMASYPRLEAGCLKSLGSFAGSLLL